MANPIDRPPSTRIVGIFLRAATIAAARLRFLAVFALVFLVIGGWETIRTHWGRWTGRVTNEPAISSDTDFFCPMDPGVLSDWPSKCPVCNMTLVRRKKGDAVPLPDGVVARMQFTPYRLWLGGIRTAAVEYAPLARTIEAPGTVASHGTEPCRIEAEVFADERPWIAAGRQAEVTSIGFQAAPPFKAIVRELQRDPDAATKVILELQEKATTLKTGERVRVRVLCPVEELELLRGLPSSPPALVAREPRRLYRCMDHADVVRLSPGPCPLDHSELMTRALRDNQRVRWWCPMHPSATAERPGGACDACGGMPLAPRVVSFRLPGTVLSVPGSAVIDDGSRTLVYVERGAGMFDATVVTLGPRCGASFPVVSGLEPGDRVAAQGGFLIDAETRLDPGLAVAYFGAGERAHTGAKSTASDSWVQELPAADRSLAVRQKRCPVTGKALGSMGVPPKIDVSGRHVFLCCDGCATAIQANPRKYLAKLPREDREESP